MYTKFFKKKGHTRSIEKPMSSSQGLKVGFFFRYEIYATALISFGYLYSVSDFTRNTHYFTN